VDHFDAIAGEIEDGFRVKAKLYFTGSIIGFIGKLIKAFVTGKEPDWTKEYPAGLPFEVDAQIILKEVSDK
jgi:hypothetical protein